MVNTYDDDAKHKTGVGPKLSDFVKHNCPNKVEKWVKGKKEAHSVQVKKEFNAIKGNEEMVPVNARAADTCGICGTPITDASFMPCTQEDLEALEK